ncbi:MAG: thioredoxin-like domain-containing protein [Bacteroidota bacterium]
MRQPIYLIVFVFLLLAGCHQNKYEINGTIENAEGEMLVLEKMELDRDQPVDSTELDKSGDFTFRGEKLDVPTFFKLKLSSSNFMTLLVDSTETLSIEADGKNLEKTYRVKGSPESKKIQILNQRLKKLRHTVDSLLAIYESLPEEGKTERKEEIGRELSAAMEEHKDFIGSFVMDNPRSFASYYALFQRLSDGSMVLNVMNENEQVWFSTVATSLDILYPESPRVKQLYNYVLSAKARERQGKLMQELEEKAEETIPDIKEKNIEGEEIALSSLRGKVVLLSFWASWDEDSRRENQRLKDIYQQYHDQGFEVYQVSLDRSKVLWENAIKRDNLPWINVSDLQYTDSYPAKLYNINQLPSNYLISRDGEIIGKNLFGDMLREKLEEVL